jgi:hypothetical protein
MMKKDESASLTNIGKAADDPTGWSDEKKKATVEKLHKQGF